MIETNSGGKYMPRIWTSDGTPMNMAIP
jgi:hypothetical protein